MTVSRIRGALRGGAIVALTLMLLALLACARGPQPIAFNADTCEYCRMQISDPRFGGEIVTHKGKVLKFDSIECLVDYYKQPRARADAASIWVIDFTHPGTLIDARTARYLELRPGMSPMGRALAAAASDADTTRLRDAGVRSVMTWSQVQ